MLTSVITFLIYICILAIVIYLVIWVLHDVIGLPIPARVIQLLWVIIALIAILWLVQMVLPGIPHLRISYLLPWLNSLA
jgi:hypothetical protein